MLYCAGVSTARIAVLPAALADQIAAGEVVERPASIVKELVDNAVDAGASRIEIELEGGGRDRIRVVDDGRGIHRDDLPLAVTRHATSKLRDAAQLVEIETLGFRGEALASIAAVARLEIRSRRSTETIGYRLQAKPGEAPTVEPTGMPDGTQVEVAHLFANVPARRKFLRSEATEVGHCVDAVIRVALVQPAVHFKLRHGGRELLDLPSADASARVAAILRRRGGEGPFEHVRGERRGVAVEAWFAPPAAASRQRNASFVVVRGRVVRERTLAGVLRQAYGDQLPAGTHPVACLFVEPPRGTVDVNVHPQKSEVRFSGAQDVFAAVREVVEAGLADAPWVVDAPDPADPAGPAGPEGSGDAGDPARSGEDHGWARPRSDARSALAGWSRRESLGGGSQAAEANVGYRLGTRAAGGDYAADKRDFRRDVDTLRAKLVDRGEPGFRARGRDATGGRPRTPGASLPFPLVHPEAPLDDGGPDAPELRSGPGSAQPRANEPPPGIATWPRFLTCLPGPLALFELEGELLAVDLRRLRAARVRRRLVRELAETTAGRRIPAQGLLEPVVIRRGRDEHGLLVRSTSVLGELGIEIEGFGEDTVLVRAVPAVLRDVLEARQVDALLDRLTPWLRLREQASAEAAGSTSPTTGGGFVDAVAEVVHDRTVDSSPRLARRWLAEALRECEGDLSAVPGLRRFTAGQLS